MNGLTLVEQITGAAGTGLTTLPSLVLIGGGTIVFLILARLVKAMQAQTVRIATLQDDLDLLRRAAELHVMVNVSDADGKMVYVNDKLVDSLGYPRESMIGRSLSEFLAKSNEASKAKVLAVLRQGKVWHGESSIRRRDGGIIRTRTSIFPSLDKRGNLIETISMRTDITDSVAQAAEIQGRVAMNRLPQEVYVFDIDTLRLLYVNERALAVQGWSGQGYAGRTLGETSDNFDEAAFRQRIQPMVDGEVETLSYESVHYGKPVNIALQFDQCLDGSSRIIASVEDISQRKRAEETKAQFVATVTHELRSPLTSVMGALKLVTSGKLGALSEKSLAMLTVAQCNVDRAILLINDILDLEKLESGTTNIEMTPLDLVPLVEDSVAAIKGYGVDLDVTFAADLAGDPVFIKGNRAFLEQVMTNLLSNAAKFSHRGGTVTITLGQEGGMARIAVADRGAGIPDEAQGQLFERFAQVQGGAPAARRGTGLGLSIAKSVVERHGGRIYFKSKEGEGTTFFVDIPVLAEMRNAA